MSFKKIYQEISRITGKPITSLDDIRKSDTEENSKELFFYLAGMADAGKYRCSIFCAEQALKLCKKYSSLKEFTETAEKMLTETSGEYPLETK